MARPVPGKYDAVLPSLKPLPPADAGYQEKVDRAKEQITDRAATALAAEYARLRAEKDKANAALSAINLRIEAYEQLLAESQESRAEGWGQFGVKDNALRLASGETVRIQKEPYGKVADKEAFRLWCIANGYERQLQLWPSTMNALVKERLLTGEEPPDGTEAFSYVKVMFVKAGAE